MLAAGDGVLLVADSRSAIAEAAATARELEQGRIVKDRSALDYIRVFVCKATWSACRSSQLPLPTGFPLHLLHVRRYDMDLVPTPDLTLEFGDRVGVIAPPDRKEEVRRHFGDTVKSTAEFSYVSLGIGMVLGVLLGLIPIPIPGVGTVTLGIGGGPLIVALILGKLRRTGPMLWVMPLPANIVLRNFGLAMFLAAVGINSGQPFVKTVSENGPAVAGHGAVVLLTTVLIVLLVGYYLLKIPFDDLVGVASGATGNPAILVYSLAHGADRAAGYRLRDDLPVDDAGQSHRRADRRPLGDVRCGLKGNIRHLFRRLRQLFESRYVAGDWRVPSGNRARRIK